jgi:hypothetical protein
MVNRGNERRWWCCSRCCCDVGIVRGGCGCCWSDIGWWRHRGVEELMFEQFEIAAKRRDVFR